MKSLLVLVAFLSFASFSFADGIAIPRPGVAEIESYLDVNAFIPMVGNTDYLIASNLIVAQNRADLDQSDSLMLSIDSVLRADWIEGYYGSMKSCDRWDCPILWAQSNIAIDDRAHVTLWPPNIDFGKKNIVTPEPSTLTLAVMGFLLLVLAPYVTRKRKTA